MTKIANFLFLAVTIISMVACNSASTDRQSGETAEKTKASFDLTAAKSTIEDANKKFMETFKKGDSMSLATFYASDGTLMPPNSEPVKRADIAGAWGSFIRMGVSDLKLITDDVYGNEDVLTETGQYEIYGAEDKLVDKGKYIVVWKSENGEWKLYRDIWNTNLPAAQAPAK